MFREAVFVTTETSLIFTNALICEPLHSTFTDFFNPLLFFYIRTVSFSPFFGIVVTSVVLAVIFILKLTALRKTAGVISRMKVDF